MKRRLVGSLAGLLVLGLAIQPSAQAAEPETAALEVLDDFMHGVNARDVDAMEAQFHFPHFRIASGQVSILEKAGQRPDLFKRFIAAAPGWDHSEWDKRVVIQSGPNKVHLATRFIRYRSDGSLLASYDSLYIVTRKDGRWAIEARSSFAP